MKEQLSAPDWFDPTSDDPSMYRKLAEWYEKQAGERVDKEELQNYYLIAAKKGDRIAALKLVDLIYRGELVCRDVGLWADAGSEQGEPLPLVAWALEQFQAIERGAMEVEDQRVTMDRFSHLVDELKTSKDPQALYYLGMGFLGVEQPINMQLAFNCLVAAAEFGSVAALSEVALGVIDQRFSGDLETGVRLLERAAGMGSGEACYRLAQCYDQGIGTEQNKEKAVYWLEKAAAQGYELAFFALGWDYDMGCGVDKNSYEAVRWYSRGAEEGHPASQFALAMAHLLGDGCSKSTDLAFEWLEKSAAQNHIPALTRLADLKTSWASKYDLKEDYEGAFELLKRAAELGDQESMARLSECYASGTGCRQDTLLARVWTLKAQGEIK